MPDDPVTTPTIPGPLPTFPPIPPDTEDPFLQLLLKLQAELQGDDLFDRALAHYVVTRLVTLVAEAGEGSGLALDLPIKSTAEVTRETKNDDGSATSCHFQGISVGGFHLIGWETCHTVSGTGTGHLTAGMATVGKE
jgi:hypothetical protein